MAACKELAILLVIVSYLATTGYCYQLPVEEKTFSTKEICKRSLLNSTIHTAIAAAKKQSSPCPCAQNVMETDVTFQFQQGCYVQMMYENGVKNKCCYDHHGNLMVGAPNGGYIIIEQFEQDIKMAKHTCCQDSQTCDDFYSFNPSDDCSTFKVLHPAKSWGDPQITTIDHNTFSFNGHGEYVYLLLNDSEWETEIQARTDYLEKGNIDATIFVAFVIHVHKRTGNKSDILHVHQDEDNLCVAVYLKNDTRLNTSIAPLQSSLFYIFYANKSSVLIRSSVQDVRVEIHVSYLKNLGLAISVVTPLNGLGLAGNTTDNKFVARNGTHYPVNASEEDLFQFGESWSVRNASESKFHYNITEDWGNFTFYNRNHSKPRFLESLTSNLTQLFKGWSQANITNFTSTCRTEWNNKTSKDCLLAIARSKKLETGIAVITELRRQHDMKRRRENKAPTFKPDMVTHVFVNYSDVEPLTINLSKYVEDLNNDTLTFEVLTNINSSTYTIDNTTGLFEWNVSGQARWEEVAIMFVVKDEFSQRPSPLFISYCGCQKEEQCDFTFLEPLNSTGKFERYGCSCTGLYTSGRFCESRIDPCENINCTSGDFNLGCDNSSDADNPCELCPLGYQTHFVKTPLRQQTCENIDECDIENPCDHKCNDTDGGYTCSCYEGFALDSTNNGTCIDIDECKEGIKVCKANEVCYDLQGNATCLCAAGFRRSPNAENCKKIDGFSYTFTMALIVSDPDPHKLPTKYDAKQELWNTLNNGINFTDLIINRVYYDNLSNSSRKRRETVSDTLHIDYTVVMKEKTTYPALQTNLTKLMQMAGRLTLGNISMLFDSKSTIKIPKDCQLWETNLIAPPLVAQDLWCYKSDHALPLEQFRLVDIDDGVNQLYFIPVDGKRCQIQSKPGGSCSLGDDCDKTTSHCMDNNGTLSCECKDGFIDVKKGSKYCRDIDECNDGNFKLTERCVGGKCYNDFGGWNCLCPPNTTWAKVGDNVYPYSYRCQGNHSYIGNISLYRHVTEKWEKDNLTSFLQDLFKLWFDNETTISKHTPSLTDLYMNTTVFRLNVTKEFLHGDPFGYWYNCSFVLTLGDAVDISRIEEVSQNGRHIGLRPEICTGERDDCRIFHLHFYNDTDNILCKLGNKCDMVTTTCDVSSGVYRCECRIGFDRFDDYICRDRNECELPVSHNSCISTGGTCDNSIGNWSCTCDEGYEAKMYNFDNRTCEEDNSITTTPQITTGPACDKKCPNGGACSVDGGQEKCRCSGGESCEVKINTHDSSKRLKIILIATAGSFGGVVLIFVITVVIICKKRKNDAKKKPNKEDNISLSTIGNNFSSKLRIRDNKTSNVDRVSHGSSFSSNVFGPGYIPRVSLLAGSEPRPDYDSPPVSQKPVFQRSGSMNVDYGRHGSPNYDFHGQQFLRNSHGSYERGMDASHGSMDMEYFGHKKPVANPLYAEVKRKT